MTYLTPEIITNWIAALKSGQYLQGIGKLRSVYDKYCCLGVLCDVLHQTQQVGEWEQNSTRDISDGVSWYLTFPSSHEEPITSAYLLTGYIGQEFSYLFNQPTVKAVFLDYLKHANPRVDQKFSHLFNQPTPSDIFVWLNDKFLVPFPVLADLLTTALPHMVFEE
jgi:hypothetical protein